MGNSFRNCARIALLTPAILLCLAFVAGAARAQVLYGSVIGSVTDTAGSSVTGVGREGVDERVVRFGLRISF